MSLRVLQICDFHLKYAAQLSRGLLDEGCEVAFLSRAHDGEFGGKEGARRAYLAEQLAGRAATFEIPGRVRDARALPVVASIARRLRAWRPDVVHVQESADLRVIAAGGRLAGGYAVTIHDPQIHHGEHAGAWFERAARTMYVRRAGLIFVHGERLEEELVRRHHPRAPVAVVPHGTGEAVVEPLPGTPELLFFGRMSPYKGLDVLLDAMPAVWAAEPATRLTIAGEGPLPEHPLLGDDRLRILNGHVPDEDVAGLFSGSTCVVLPYREASQSGVGTLAQRYGRPIVASALGGLPELVPPETGRTVPPEDPAALATAIREVVGDPSLAKAMGDAAAARIDAVTGWRAVARASMAAYERHLRPRTARR